MGNKSNLCRQKGKKTVLKGNVHNYYISGGKLYTMVDDAGYLFDTNKKTFKNDIEMNAKNVEYDKIM